MDKEYNKFKQFLLNNDYYNSFCSKVEKRHKIIFKKYFDDRLPWNFVTEAFSWSLSSEGYEYWYNTYKRWADEK